jgi:hypothetical protein
MMTFGGDGIRHADAKKSALQGDVLQGSMTAPIRISESTSCLLPGVWMPSKPILIDVCFRENAAAGPTTDMGALSDRSGILHGAL